MKDETKLKKIAKLVAFFEDFKNGKEQWLKDHKGSPYKEDLLMISADIATLRMVIRYLKPLVKAELEDDIIYRKGKR